MDSQNKKAVYSYVAFQLLFNLLLWVPVFYEVQKQLGMSDPEIFRIQSIYYLVFCFLEIPTGFIADRFGYKTSMIAGAVTLVTANTIPVFAGNFAGFLTHFCLIALARSLISGAGSAWLYEYLKGHGKQDLYKKIEGDARFYSLVARVLSWAAVGYLMTASLMLPYWISAANALVATVIVLSLPAVTPTAIGKTNVRSSGSGFLAAGITVIKTPLLLLLMLQGVGIFILVRVLQVNLYQPVLSEKSFDATSFGLIMSVMTVFEALGAKQSHRLRRLSTDLTMVMVSTVLLSLTVVVIAFAGKDGTIAGFCLFSMLAGIAFPIQKQLLNDAITNPGQRATILSVESFVDRALCAAVVLPLGGLIASGKLHEILVTCGLAFAFVAVIIQSLLKKFSYSTEDISLFQPVLSDVKGEA